MNPPPVQPVNPYAPPLTLGTPGLSEEHVLPPRVWPRHWTDFAWGLGIAVPAGILVYALPVGLALRVGFNPLLPVLAVAFLAWGVIGISLKSLTVSPQGILVRRNLLLRRQIGWNDISRIYEASALELIGASVLTPHLICPACFSFRKYYRFDWSGGHFYFPPRDVELFKEALQTWAPNLRIEER